MVDPRCRVKRVSGFSSAHFSFALHTSRRLSDHGISSFSLPELALPHFDGSGWNFPQAALAGGGTTRTTNLGGVYITVNGYNARNDDELAQIVADKINGMIHEDDSVFK